MKSIRNVLAPLFILVGFVASINLLYAQDTTAPDSIVQVTAEGLGLSLVSPTDVPEAGTFWLVMSNGIVPDPAPLFDPTLPVFQIADNEFLVDATCGQVAVDPDQAAALGMGAAVSEALAEQATNILNVINQVQAAQVQTPAAGRSRMMSLDDLAGGGLAPALSFSTNSLWLQITNVANGLACLNLMNGTDYVYCVWGSTNLAGGWQIEAEVFPTGAQTNALPFTVSALNRPNLFLRAEDWTGVDSDGDGVPDWWAWRYWGTNNLPDTNADYSGSGATFAADFANGQAPTVFAFTNLEAANDYVSNMSVPVRLDVAGSPYYLAISVDDTNYAADANWQIYTGTSMTVNLGLTEGWHDVWIGLRGHGDDAASAVWQWKRLKLDFTPPLLAVTNPATVSTPLIQLQGYSPEALGSISYDLTNALGWLTNQPVLISDQFYDTNTWESTTNWFQAYDVPLANGLNSITLHATDLAGNETTTNFTFTVDYSGATNPAINLFWPQDGQQVSGGSFAWRGWVDDPTATVTATITDASGDTNTVNGLVDRSGNFWAETLPLAEGTNYLTLFVTNAAGLSSATNIVVVQSLVSVTINPVTDDLWQPAVGVSGTISDPTYSVWVNGVPGTNHGDGTWGAANVPVDSGGWTTLNATAYPPGDDPAGGSGSGGGASGSSGPGGGDGGAGSANPADPSAPSTELEQDKQPHPYMAQYIRTQDASHENYNSWVTVSGPWDPFCYVDDATDTIHDEVHQAADQSGWSWHTEDGQGSSTDWQGHTYNSDGLSSILITWGANGSGAMETDTPGDGSYPPAGLPVIWSEHCEVDDPQHSGNVMSGDEYVITHKETQTYTRTAETRWKLQTGGRAGVQRQSLFQFTAQAKELLDKRAGPPFWWSNDGETTLGYPGVDISAQDITILGQPLGADGNLWKTLPDNATLDVTPQVAGKDFYTFSVGAGKYWLYVAGNSQRLGDVTLPNPRFCVGQQIIFSPSWVPFTPPYSHATADWTLPGTFVNRQSSTCDAYYDENAALLHCDSTANSALSTSCWYVDKLQSGSASVAVNLSFANGQQVSLNNSGMFDVYRPKIVQFFPNNDGTPTPTTDGSTLSLGTDLNHDMGFAHQIQSDFPGVAGYTQLISGEYTESGTGNTIYVGGATPDTELDNREFPRGQTQLPTVPFFYDAPHVGLSLKNDSTTMEDLTFNTYLLFKPDGNGSIFVPLRLVIWNVNDYATYNAGGGWTAYGSATITSQDDTTTFPFWINTFSNLGL